jgi:hypothetical protein
MAIKLDLKNKKQLAAVVGGTTIVASALLFGLYKVGNNFVAQTKPPVTEEKVVSTAVKSDDDLTVIVSTRPDIALPKGGYSWRHTTGVDDLLVPFLDKMHLVSGPDGSVLYVKNQAMVIEQYPANTKVALPVVSDATPLPEQAQTPPTAGELKVGGGEGVDLPFTKSENTVNATPEKSEKPLIKSTEKSQDELYLVAKIKLATEKEWIVRWRKRGQYGWFELSDTPDGKSVYRAGRSEGNIKAPLLIHSDGSLLTVRNNFLWCQRYSLEKATWQNNRFDVATPSLVILNEAVSINRTAINLYALSDGKQKIAQLAKGEAVVVLGEAGTTFKSSVTSAHAFLIRSETSGLVGWVLVTDGQPPFESAQQLPWRCGHDGVN